MLKLPPWCMSSKWKHCKKTQCKFNSIFSCIFLNWLRLLYSGCCCLQNVGIIFTLYVFYSFKENKIFYNIYAIPVAYLKLFKATMFSDSACGYSWGCWWEPQSRGWYWSGWGSLCHGTGLLADGISDIQPRHRRAVDKQNMGKIFC